MTAGGGAPGCSCDGYAEAAKAAAKAAPSTKAQQAIAEMREQGKAAARKKSAAERRETASRKRALRSEKRKEKHRGH